MTFLKKIWRDEQSGGTPINSQDLNRIEQGIADNADAWDSICQDLANDTGWVNIWVATNVTFRARRIGKWVTLRGETRGVCQAGVAWTDATVLPVGMRPSQSLFFPGVALEQVDRTIHCNIEADGHLWARSPGAATSYWGCTITFPVA